MFLTKNNTIKWKWIGIVAAITILLCMLGILGLDKPVFLFLRKFDWSIWGVFDIVFATKVWLMATAFATIVAWVINKIKSKKKFKFPKLRFKEIKSAIINQISDIKNNPAFLMFCSVAAASIVGGVLKVVLGRARPVFFEALDKTGFFPMTSDWAFNSMPSGHATASFAALVMVGLLFPKIKWATWTAAIIIGVSRICYGAHWPSDVILGAFIGMCTADIVKSNAQRARGN